MALQQLIHNYTAYNAWANTAMADWLLSIPTETLYRSMPSSFTTIDYTAQHILRIQKYWLAFISEQDTTHLNWSVYENEAVRILNELKSQSHTMHEILSQMTEADLEKTLHLDTAWAKNNLSRYEYIVHAVNHSTYHRGQIVTMARNFGITEGIPATDYNFFHGR